MNQISFTRDKTAIIKGFAIVFMISDNLWIIALWTIILSYVCSCIIKKIVEI